MGMSRIYVLERNKLVQRKVLRILTCTGAEVIQSEDPAELSRHLDSSPAVLCADAVDIATVSDVLQSHPMLRGLVWTASKTDPLLGEAEHTERLDFLLGRDGKDAAPREWELLYLVRRLLGGESPGLGALLAWGYTGFKELVHNPTQRDACVEGVVRFCQKLNMPGRVQEMFAELSHELLMNAMYDAPVDSSGRPKYSQDRKAQITLEPEEAATIRCASDGMRMVISVSDPFGRLPRRAVFGGMARGLRGGEMDQRNGGAGLGMMYIYRASAIAIFEVMPGVRTQVTSVYEIDTNQREFRNLPRSVHFFGDR
ncbi:MAG: hypothetical protein RBU30_11835 [Polyangia bacterium]|jgi:hypothetical protein|nr:hypothetical protein [Polyangia bacterium]